MSVISVSVFLSTINQLLSTGGFSPPAPGHVLSAQEVQAATANYMLSDLAQCTAATISTA